jgi:hypothetical protein
MSVLQVEVVDISYMSGVHFNDCEVPYGHVVKLRTYVKMAFNQPSGDYDEYTSGLDLSNY